MHKSPLTKSIAEGSKIKKPPFTQPVLPIDFSLNPRTIFSSSISSSDFVKISSTLLTNSFSIPFLAAFLIDLLVFSQMVFQHIFSMAPRFRGKRGDGSCLFKTALAYCFNLTQSHSAELLGLRENPYLMTFIVHNYYYNLSIRRNYGLFGCSF